MEMASVATFGEAERRSDATPQVVTIAMSGAASSASVR
jgi:hypothetical protein